MKKLISIFLVALTLTTLSFAGSFDDFLRNSISSMETTSPYSVNSQERGYWIGGGFRVKINRTVINPVRIELPKIRAGCEGIDITLGAFDFLDDVDELVHFLEQALTSATAVTLGGLQAVCPTCSTIITKLNTIANQINSLQMDSCELGKKIGGLAGSWVSDVGGLKIMDGTFSKFKDVIEHYSNRANKLLDDWLRMKKINGCDPADDKCPYSLFRTDAAGNFVYKSVLDKVITNTYLNGSSDGLALIRSLIGDIYLIKGTGEDTPLEFKYVPPIYKDSSVREVIEKISFGNANGSICNPNVSITVLLDDATEQTQNNSFTPVCNDVIDKMDDIVNKFYTRTALTPMELEFLSYFKIPIYKVLNTFSIEQPLLKSFEFLSVNVLTYELTYNNLVAILSEVNRSLIYISSNIDVFGNKKYNNILQNHIQKIERNISNVLQEAYRLYTENLQEWNESISSLNSYQEIEKRIYGRMVQNPVIGAYLFTKGLSQ